MKKEIKINDLPLSIESGNIAKQADSAVTVRYGDTVVFTAVVGSKEPKEEVDFLPLLVDYREHTSAAGKFPGGFFKREGRPSEKEILTSRLIDRSIRPLFPENYKNEIQVNSFVFSADTENDSDILALIGASTALSVSKIPFLGPIGVVRVGYADNKFIINPTFPQLEESKLNLVVAGTETSIIMLEGMSSFISEDLILEAISLARKSIGLLVNVQKEFESKKEKRIPSCRESNPKLWAEMEKEFSPKIKDAYNFPGKGERDNFWRNLSSETLKKFASFEEKTVKQFLEEIKKEKIRKLILDTGKRLDGRKSNQLREISCEIGLLPRTHGSALFTRGETQALALVTLGTTSDEQIMDTLFEESSKRFMVHYNFPAFSVGEVRPNRGPGRREIGHGILAERALSAVVPSEEDFPYTVRVVSETLSSNGSSSMATVCGGSLALMNAGVPVSSAVAGISVGLIQEGERKIILTDIAGEEDHFGNLDLKIAGTSEGITAIQMDVKSALISEEILKQAFFQSKEARLEILKKMSAAISQPQKSLSPYAPKIINLQIPVEKIGLLIGPGGKTIRKIISETGAKIDVNDEGEVKIASTEQKNGEEALEKIKALVEEAAVGKFYAGKVTKIMPFGAFVEILPKQEGLIHISELEHKHVDKVEDVLKVGDKVKVKVIKINEGKISLSRKQALPDAKK
ncbi:MAG: polyribonucleotide nucleotidyltransferase [bacterium (Candidatus Ratteibacteria) CG15_BIG_FIL_POST_REV_8_21_14_020_41_12]|uniref:Polyribonucleotide nucleotidyltransferase n=1 Tax=bacterium (Candidatus Ratteibacteria) CG15_BIG_FIL_POST_REV_8_21_14_020_41_12 TaxID=2014291 RepID=A0A2M7H0C3_9BACT|nr:MAG: polyribonucleotide nucleotidyltransferase [bacterium (Candidatus Ratteibacteria) CG15_BIG_FIL_POST_REV_8_21_14_020_41_12]